MDHRDSKDGASVPIGQVAAPKARTPLRSAAEYLRRQRGRVSGLVAHSDRLVRINRLLRAYLPPHLRDHARIVAVGPHCWTVQTDSSAWATRLRYVLPPLQKQLSGELKEPVPVLRVRIKPASAKRSVVAGRRLTLTQDNARLLEGAADGIADRDLGAALRRLAQHARQQRDS